MDDSTFYIKWAKEIKKPLMDFIKRMENPSFPGAYYYSLSGDLYKYPKYKTGLGNTVFATRILYILNELKNSKKLENAKFILSFTNPDTGAISDPIVRSKSRLRRYAKSFIRFDFANIFNQQTSRAETRQSYEALKYCVVKPLYKYQKIPKTLDEIKLYIARLNWEKNPWGASSHVSHLFYFLKFFADYFDENDESSILINCVLNEIKKYQQPDGSWY